MQSNSVQVSAVQGAGGNWLASVLGHCITPNFVWANQNVNFHSSNKINLFHNPIHTDNTLSIGNNPYKYNFWKLYSYKTLLHQHEYVRHKGKKFIITKIETPINAKNSFFWLINQCRFIQNYQCPGKFQVDWKDLFDNPECAWITICDFFEYNKIKNYSTFSQFEGLLNNYKQTCTSINYKINVQHKLFLIWSLAFLQNNNYTAPMDIFEEFGSNKMKLWISEHHRVILEYTNNNILPL
jgi:hypothetical protein